MLDFTNIGYSHSVEKRYSSWLHTLFHSVWRVQQESIFFFEQEIGRTKYKLLESGITDYCCMEAGVNVETFKARKQAINTLVIRVAWKKFYKSCSIVLFFRFIHTQQPVTGNASIQASRRRSEIKIVRMIALAIAAFVLSWSPYCFVSIAGTIRGSSLLTAGEAEVPDLLAKASVIYNPIVYTVMNDRFRGTLLRVIPCRRWFNGDINPTVSVSAPNSQNGNSHHFRERPQSVKGNSTV